jgi:hypothetical protein
LIANFKLWILDFFQNPQYQPFCSNWQDILAYIYQSYYINGLAGLVLTFSNEDIQDISTKKLNSEEHTIKLNKKYLQYGNFKYLQNADAIATNSNTNNIAFNVSLGNNIGNSRQYIFHIDTNDESKTYGNYINTSKDETKILIVFKNYDFHKKCFISPLAKIQHTIMAQNSVNRATLSFYQNSCRPSGILLAKRRNGSDAPLNDKEEKEYDRMVSKIAQNFKGTMNTGEVMMPSSPNFDLDFKPITVPTDYASDKSYNEMFAEMIYAFFHGGSKSAFEGISEYSNNAFQKQKTMYDGAFQTVNSVVISTLNIFLRNYFMQVMGVKPSEVKNLYFNLNKSGIDFYKEAQKLESQDLFKANIISQTEARVILANTDDNYGNLEPLETNKFYSEIGKSNTVG